MTTRSSPFWTSSLRYFGYATLFLVTLVISSLSFKKSYSVGYEWYCSFHNGQPFARNGIPKVTAIRVRHQDFYVTLDDAGHIVHQQIKRNYYRYEQIQDYCCSIAIGGGITSLGLEGISSDDIKIVFPFFTTFLPSFCRTFDRSTNLTYTFYLAYDWTDVWFTSKSFRQAFQNAFNTELRALCGEDTRRFSLHLVECGHSASPAWAQNDAMMAAYMDNHDYYYRVNDDSVLETMGWLGAFVATLGQYDPPNMGVVGPTHSGGNVDILTYDFVHRTHIDVFGFYYPRVFTDWYADEWITKIYEPQRSVKLKGVLLAHTMSAGTRYDFNRRVSSELARQIKHDQNIVDRYIAYKLHSEQSISSSSVPDSSKVIALSLYDLGCPRLVNTALRVAQLARIIFPGWLLRIYVDSFSVSEESGGLQNLRKLFEKLRFLGAQIVLVKPELDTHFCRSDWSLLTVYDSNTRWLLVMSNEVDLLDYEPNKLNRFLSNIANTYNEIQEDSNNGNNKNNDNDNIPNSNYNIYKSSYHQIDNINIHNNNNVSDINTPNNKKTKNNHNRNNRSNNDNNSRSVLRGLIPHHTGQPTDSDQDLLSKRGSKGGVCPPKCDSILQGGIVRGSSRVEERVGWLLLIDAVGARSKSVLSLSDSIVSQIRQLCVQENDD